MNILKHKNAFQWDAYRPLVDYIPACTALGVSAQGGLPGGSARGVSDRGGVPQHEMGQTPCGHRHL